MGLKKICWSLGITKEEWNESSEILYTTGKVASKKFSADLFLPQVGEFGDEHYDICLRSEIKNFKVNNENLFRRLNVEDDVKIGYREIYTTISDYVPPNFDNKQQISKVLSGYRFVSGEKLNQ